jgi:hypothetical protein
MAGAGYKLFNTGDVLTAAQVNTYLNEQTVMVFASSAARTSALSGVLAEGMVSYLQDTNAVEVYNGSAWVNVGNAGDITEVQAGTGISVASGTGPIPVITNTVATAFDAAGDLVYGTGADTFTKLSLGTAGKVLTVNSGATAPEWATPAGGGKVLQVVGATTTTATTIASATLTDTGITASITPSSATSKILVMVTAEFKHFRNGAGFSGIAAELFRGATSIADWNKTDADEFDFIQYAGSSANTYKSGTTTVIYLDSPSTTSSTTYKLQARGYDASVSVTFQQNSAISTITLLEIGA